MKVPDVLSVLLQADTESSVLLQQQRHNVRPAPPDPSSNIFSLNRIFVHLLLTFLGSSSGVLDLFSLVVSLELLVSDCLTSVRPRLEKSGRRTSKDEEDSASESAPSH